MRVIASEANLYILTFAVSSCCYICTILLSYYVYLSVHTTIDSCGWDP